MPGCPTLTREGRCTSHQRPTAARRGYDAEWQKLRAAYLAAHPDCVSCGAPATDVDHIDGGGPYGSQGNDESNLQSLCHPCHARKTATSDGGYRGGRAAT